MAYREIPAEAVEAGKPASPYLLRNFRDNDLGIDHHAQSILAQLHETTGHPHGEGTESYTYLFRDRIETRAGVNDQFTFRFGGGAIAAATHTVTLDPGVRTLSAHAAHVQAKMRAAASATTAISVGYDTDEESETRGLFRLQHTGGSDSPNPRVFQILGRSGAGTALPPMGIAKRDQKGAYGYVGESGSADGYVEEVVIKGDGGLLEDDAWVPGAFTTDKYADSVIPTAAFDDGSVTGAKLQSGAATGVKIGPPVESSTFASIDPGDSHTFTITLPNGGSTRIPHCTPVCANAPGTNVIAQELLVVTSISHVSGNTWHVQVLNLNSNTCVTFVEAY